MLLSGINFVDIEMSIVVTEIPMTQQDILICLCFFNRSIFMKKYEYFKVFKLEIRGSNLIVESILSRLTFSV